MSVLLENANLTDKFKYRETNVKENKYIIGTCKVNNTRKIILTNLHCCYEEILKNECVIRRSEVIYFSKIIL